MKGSPLPISTEWCLIVQNLVTKTDSAGPFLPDPPLFPKDENFREFLLNKRKYFVVTKILQKCQCFQMQYKKSIISNVNKQSTFSTDKKSTFSTCQSQYYSS